MSWLGRAFFPVWALLLFAGSPFVAAQEVRSSDNKPDAPVTAAMQLEDVRLRGNLASLLAQLALQSDIPIGFERAMNAGDENERRLKFENITLGDLLTQLVAEYKQYSWEIREGVVYVSPKEGHGDPIVARLLNVEIKTFSLKELKKVR